MFVCLLSRSRLAELLSAQVLSLGKVNDPVSKRLQKQYFAQLQQIATEATTIHFPYPFYFSQTLDIDEARQKQLPQGSIRFDQFNGQTVLAISGNYYISYSSSQLNGNQRARKTYEDVVLPLLKAAVARTDRSVPFEAYAFEISHHVRNKVLKVNTEGAENLMILFPRAVAETAGPRKRYGIAAERPAGERSLSQRRAVHALAHRRRRTRRRKRPLPGAAWPC